ncbi:hypothetical protein JG687_00006751 [Phytophthora cactorum]|uniref:WW domain-containing protein n=1 Tax=Phytophthora cactorum TaxID=29920 RepID=A0A8T1UM53_9STRA|nr:hypothetical protein JG687_00006751 [Phytophthora cactorum]
MSEEENSASHQSVKEDGGEWTSSRRVGRRARTAANRGENRALTVREELQVDTRSNAETERAAEEGHEREEIREAGRGRSSTGSEHSDQLEEPVIPVTVLTSMEAEIKPPRLKSSGFVPAEHVAGRDEGEDTEDDIALLEYLSGAESDYYELDRASRKGEDAEAMSSSPRSQDESLGTPGSPGGLLAVDEHGGFGQSPIRYMTVTRRMMVHAQEAPRQASPQVVESPPSSSDTEGESVNTEAKPAATVPRRTRATPQESDSEWIPCETEDGLTYYYNQHTQESQWTIPTAPDVRTYSSDELFAAVSDEELSVTDSRHLSIMLHSGMDLQAVNSDGLTPLHVACKVGNEQAAALLVYYGANLDSRAIRDDATPLILACRAESEGIAKLLVESNASLSACDSNGNTALHVAVQTGNEGLIMFVLRGCDHTLLSQKNNEGETALHIAAKLGSFGIVRSLLAYGASVKDEDSQEGPNAKEQQKSEAGDTNTSTTLTEHEADSEDGDDLTRYEESRLMLSETQYEPLTPPPEIEEALRRAKAGQLGSVYEPQSSAAPTYPITRQDLSKHMTLSPSLRNPSKPHPPAAPTKIRARYVDTFNAS